MDSIDVSHVPPPDPATYWEFRLGRVLLLCEKPHISLRVTHVERDRAGMTMEHEIYSGGRDHVHDFLNLDKPCVAISLLDGQPAITLTLRKTEYGKAWIQVTAHPDLKLRERTSP